MTEDDPYARRWKEARRRYYVFFGAWLAFPLLGTMVDKLAQLLTPGSRVLPKVFFPIYALFWLYTASQMRRWRCPRCEKPFTHTMFWRNDFATRCVHCGLPRGATLAQAESGAFEPIRFAWRRVLRGVLAGFEMLTGVIVFYMGVFGSRQLGMGLQLAAGGFFGFFLPGALLATRSRWRWWSQLLVAMTLIVLVRTRVTQRAEAGTLSASRTWYMASEVTSPSRAGVAAVLRLPTRFLGGGSESRGSELSCRGPLDRVAASKTTGPALAAELRPLQLTWSSLRSGPRI